MIRLSDVCFSYDAGGDGVSGVNLSVGAGECVVLAGPSGCGKSTITRLVNGLAPSFYKGSLSGTVSIDGADIGSLETWEVAARVGSVFQDPKSLFFSSNLAGEIAFSCENLGMAHAQIRERTDAVIGAFGLEGLRGRALDVLSSGEMQRVAMACVYAPAPKAFVLDEPTANLDDAGIAHLRAIVSGLKARGFAILVAEHRLYWLDGIADRYLYMRNGCIERTLSPEQARNLGAAEREEMGLRSLLAVPMPNLPLPQGDGMPVLAGKGLSCAKGATTVWDDVELKLHLGGITALTGQNGSGKTTLGLVLSGLAEQSAGIVEILGGAARPSTRRRHVWFGSNSTATQFFTTSVESELLLGVMPDDAALGRIRDLLRRLGLYEYRAAHPATLSGGQRQRLAIACALLSGREILVLDEPTSGLDAANMRLIAHELKRAAKTGTCMLVITHDAEFACTCCDGRIVLE